MTPLHELLGHLEDCFLVRIVSIEAASERQRMVKPTEGLSRGHRADPDF